MCIFPSMLGISFPHESKSCADNIVMFPSLYLLVCLRSNPFCFLKCFPRSLLEHVELLLNQPSLLIGRVFLFSGRLMLFDLNRAGSGLASSQSNFNCLFAPVDFFVLLQSEHVGEVNLKMKILFPFRNQRSV